MVSSRNTRCGSFTLKSFIVLSLVHVEGGQQTNVNHDYMRIEALLEYMVVEDNGAGEQADVLGPEDAEMFENIANCMVQADILSGNPRWLENFKEIKKVAIDLLYNNCRKHWTLLHFNLHLLMLMSRHGWSDTSFSDLLHMLVDAELCKDAELGEAPYYSPPHPPPLPRARAWYYQHLTPSSRAPNYFHGPAPMPALVQLLCLVLSMVRLRSMQGRSQEIWSPLLVEYQLPSGYFFFTMSKHAKQCTTDTRVFWQNRCCQLTM